jgi:hypothetical protein
MEKAIARAGSYVFHPLIMTTLGMLVMLNSGTSLSVLQPEVKRVTFILTALFTFVFPAGMIIFMFMAKVLPNIDLYGRKERTLPLALSIVLYLFTFLVMRGIPQLTVGHIVFLFCPPTALFICLILNNFMKPSVYMLGIGLLNGILLVLVLFFGASLQWIFILSILVAGGLGSARMILNQHRPGEILAGYLTGLLVTTGVMMIYLL